MPEPDTWPRLGKSDGGFEYNSGSSSDDDDDDRLGSIKFFVMGLGSGVYASVAAIVCRQRTS